MDLYKRETLKTFCLDRLDYHVRAHLGLERSMLNNYEYFQYADQTMYGLVMELRASVAKGEVVSERRTEKHEYRFDVFATWLDHLKYEIQQRRLLKWLPCWLSRRLCVRYQPIVKTRLDSYPVQVTRVCPHVNVSWDKNPKVHIHYLEGY